MRRGSGTASGSVAGTGAEMGVRRYKNGEREKGGREFRDPPHNKGKTGLDDQAPPFRRRHYRCGQEVVFADSQQLWA